MTKYSCKNMRYVTRFNDWELACVDDANNYSRHLLKELPDDIDTLEIVNLVLWTGDEEDKIKITKLPESLKSISILNLTVYVSVDFPMTKSEAFARFLELIDGMPETCSITLSKKCIEKINP